MKDTMITVLECPIAIEWTIPENRLQKFKDKAGGSLDSDIFDASNISGVRYFIRMYSNKINEKRRGKIWICLHLRFAAETHLKPYAIFCIEIQSANFCRKAEHGFSSSEGWGIACCTTNDLFDPKQGFIANGKMTVKIKGTLMIEKEVPMKHNLFCGNADTLCLELWKQQNKDFTIMVEGKEISAHKSVLAARSPVFARMFETDMKESKENKVVIEDFPFTIVQDAIRLCYHPTLVPVMKLREKLKLLQFSDKYDIRVFKDELEEHLISEIDASNVCLITNASLISNARKLEEKCTEFLRNCINAKPVSDFDILHKDFAMNLLKNSFCQFSK